MAFLSGKLAEWTRTTAFGDLPADVVESTRFRVLDVVGARRSRGRSEDSDRRSRSDWPKYNSCPVNGARQPWQVTQALQQQIVRREGLPRGPSGPEPGPRRAISHGLAPARRRR